MIVKNQRILWNNRLLPHAVGKFFKAAQFCPHFQKVQNLRVDNRRLAEIFHEHFLSQVVFGGTKPARHDHGVGARVSNVKRRFYSRGIVAHDRLIMAIQTQMRQTLGKILRVRVDYVAHQNFRAHADNFHYHLITSEIFLAIITKKNPRVISEEKFLFKASEKFRREVVRRAPLFFRQYQGLH